MYPAMLILTGHHSAYSTDSASASMVCCVGHVLNMSVLAG